jgi:nucleotide-binding universal stress UspA family protein
MNIENQPRVKMTEHRSLASIRRPTEDGPVSGRRADAPVPYQGFDGQYINGSWRPGRHSGVHIDAVSARSAPSSQMRLYPKTLTVFLDASPSGKRRAIHAAALAKRWDAHVIGVHVVFAGVKLDPPCESWAIGERAIRAVIAHEKRLRVEAEAVVVHVSEHFQALCTTWNVAGELRRIDSDQPVQEAIQNALHSDLVIVGHPEPNGLPDDTMLETILLASGVPLLVIPNAWLGEAIGNNVVIGWNASRKARRAISDAMPFLVDARAVTTLVVDPSRDRRHGEEPGADIALQLARHGMHLDVERVVSNGCPIAEVILARAVRIGSDLLVFGAYGQSRMRELLLGGTTRTLLAQMPIPVFVSM